MGGWQRGDLRQVRIWGAEFIRPGMPGDLEDQRALDGWELRHAAPVLLHEPAALAASAATCTATGTAATTLAASFVTTFIASSPMEWATVGHRRPEGLHLLR